MRFDTRLIHAAHPPAPPPGGGKAPPYPSSTFAQSGPNQHKGYVYSRSANPTRTVLESALANVESGKRGLAFSSGLGALATLLENVPTGHRIVAGNDLYGGTWRLMDHHVRQFGIDVEYVDTSDLEAVGAALESKRTDLLYVESPTNPLLKITDLAG